MDCAQSIQAREAQVYAAPESSSGQQTELPDRNVGPLQDRGAHIPLADCLTRMSGLLKHRAGDIPVADCPTRISGLLKDRGGDIPVADCPTRISAPPHSCLCAPVTLCCPC